MAAFVYIVTNHRNGTLYIGVTTNLPRRAYEHREGLIEGFSKRHGCKFLVWAEADDDMETAIKREKALKEWKRTWKLRLIEEANPDWNDLTTALHGA